MRTLWFKQRYVDPILEGTKTTTIRKQSSRLPEPDERVALSVGPRPPFAVVEIVGVWTLERNAISDWIARADGFATAGELVRALADTYPGCRTFALVRFQLAD